jgi:transcriptional regulator with XRE-family HTH domain
VIILIHERLKELRNELKLKQNEVAEKLSIASTTYSNYEQGTRNPDWQMLVKLSDFYCVSIDYIICRTNNRNEIITKPDRGQLLINSANNANIPIEELEAYVEARRKQVNNQK